MLQDFKSIIWAHNSFLMSQPTRSGLPVLNFRMITSQKRGTVPKRARIEGSQTFVSLNSRLEHNEAEKKMNLGSEGGELCLTLWELEL